MLSGTTRMPFRTSSNLFELSRVQFVVVTVSTPSTSSTLVFEIERVTREGEKGRVSERRSQTRKSSQRERRELTKEEDLVDSFDE